MAHRVKLNGGPHDLCTLTLDNLVETIAVDGATYDLSRGHDGQPIATTWATNYRWRAPRRVDNGPDTMRRAP